VTTCDFGSGSQRGRLAYKASTLAIFGDLD